MTIYQENQQVGEEIRTYLLGCKTIFPKNIPSQYMVVIDAAHNTVHDIKERIYLFANNLLNIPVCGYQGCTNPRSFISMSRGYMNGCCSDHSKRLTNIAKYGVENPSQSKVVREKTVKTNLIKYGTDNPAKSECIKIKQKNQYLTKTGFDSPLQNPAVIAKINQTNIEKYGVSNPMQAAGVQKKHQDTMIHRYGVISPMQNEDIKEKYRNNMLVLHGVDHGNKRTSFKLKFRENYFSSKICSNEYPVSPLFSLEEYLDLSRFKLFRWKCKKCNHIFQAHNENKVVPRCYKCEPSIKTGMSKQERDLVQFIDSLGVEYVLQNRNILKNGMELDILIPEKQVAIEFNGVYWHSEQAGKDSNYHLEKTKQCEHLGLTLIHVFEDDWCTRQEYIKRLITDVLGLNSEESCLEKYSVQEGFPEKVENLNDISRIDIQQNSKRISCNLGSKLVGFVEFSNINNQSATIECFQEYVMTKHELLSMAISYMSSKFVIKNIYVVVDRSDGSRRLFEDLGFLIEKEISPSYRMTNQTKNMELPQYKVWDCGHLKMKRPF